MVHIHKKLKAKKVAGVAAGAASLLGAYFLYNKKTRRKIKSWMLRARADVMDKVESAGELTKEKYNDIVDEVVATWAGVKNVDKNELKEMAADLKSHWDNIAGQLKEGRKNSRKK